MRPLLILLSALPHLYVTGVGLREAGPSAFLLGVLLWNLAPVAVGGLLAYSRAPHRGVGWLLATMAASLWAVWIGLLRPQGSTGSLIFLFLPLWNMIVVGPAGMLLAVLGVRHTPRGPRSA